MAVHRRRLAIAAWALGAVALFEVFAAVFQYGLRFRYEQIGGVLWRVDQITGQHCRVARKGADCAPLASVSTSTSTSLSVSTSTSVRAAHAATRKHG